MTNIKKIGYFSSSFDPIHKQHITICEEIIKELNLDKLFLIIIYKSNKLKKLSSLKLRINLVLNKIRNKKKIKILYTFLKYEKNLTNKIFLKEIKYKKTKNYLIFGSDFNNLIETWRTFNQIKKFFTFVIYKRPNYKIIKNNKFFYFEKNLKLESSKKIRNNLKKYIEYNKNNNFFLLKNNLYFKYLIKNKLFFVFYKKLIKYKINLSKKKLYFISFFMILFFDKKEFFLKNNKKRIDFFKKNFLEIKNFNYFLNLIDFSYLLLKNSIIKQKIFLIYLIFIKKIKYKKKYLKFFLKNKNNYFEKIKKFII